MRIPSTFIGGGGGLQAIADFSTAPSVAPSATAILDGTSPQAAKPAEPTGPGGRVHGYHYNMPTSSPEELQKSPAWEIPNPEMTASEKTTIYVIAGWMGGFLTLIVLKDIFNKIMHKVRKVRYCKWRAQVLQDEMSRRSLEALYAAEAAAAESCPHPPVVEVDVAGSKLDSDYQDNEKRVGEEGGVPVPMVASCCGGSGDERKDGEETVVGGDGEGKPEDSVSIKANPSRRLC